MTIVLSDAVIEALKDVPPPVQRAFNKQLRFLAQNLFHPSLRAKKYGGASDIWQARVTRDWRLYFRILGNAYVITALIPHPK